MLLKTNTKRWQLSWQTLNAPCMQTPQSTICAQQWLNDVQGAVQWLHDHAGRMLLYRSDLYEFSVWFFALLSLGRDIVLPSNDKPVTLAELSQSYDVRVPSKLPGLSEKQQLQTLSGSLDSQLTFFTSGSSGKPKPVIKTIRQLLNEVETLEATFGELIADSRIVSTVTHQHIYGLLFTVLWPLASGRVVNTQLIEYPEQLAEALADDGQCHVLVGSPAHLQRLDNLDELSARNEVLKAIFSSGGPLPEQVPIDFKKHDLVVPIEVYGSTETGGIAWRQRNNGGEAFTPLVGVKVRATEHGVLAVTSPHLANPEDEFISEDQIKIEQQGRFHLLGRKDTVVKIAEKRVSLNEVERFTLQQDWVSQVKACLLEGKRNEIGLVIILTDSGRKALESEGRFAVRQALRHHLQQRFEKVVAPKRFRYVSALPINDAGKVTQAALQNLFTDVTRND
ncbi:AMP-binding protein [Idiomarina piscisalsi]|uniref:Acyl-CoA synthetase n=1 Tax=Idiomarina piscisalsi TaxID=1096243 RepID=A0A432YS99_9GAMM|nr:AMP-binding protein [Idiomarina piscisalsi]RUO64466.1 acyl-CoA synthetase [Idiomarina piscisalsi]